MKIGLAHASLKKWNLFEVPLMSMSSCFPTNSSINIWKVKSGPPVVGMSDKAFSRKKYQTKMPQPHKSISYGSKSPFEFC